MVQFLSVLIVSTLLGGTLGLIIETIRGSSKSIMRALAGDFNGHNVTLLPLRPRHRAAKTTKLANSIPLRAAA
jgi:hypothetical protein